MSILDHVWGVSREQDRVWAQVSGMDPELAGKRLLMAWQVFMDESEKNGIFVLAGYLSTAEQWVKFSAEWAPLARKFGRISEDGIWYFHATEQANKPDFYEYIPAFYRVIESHAISSVALIMFTDDFKAAVDRLKYMSPEGVEQPQLAEYTRKRKYEYAFSVLLSAFFHSAYDNKFPFDGLNLGGDRVEFIFDERRSEQEKIIAGWSVVQSIDEMARRFGRTPRFEDDKEFLPLQAADFLAWWIRSKINRPIAGSNYFDADKLVKIPWGVTNRFKLQAIVMCETSTLKNLLNAQSRAYPALEVSDRLGLVTLDDDSTPGLNFIRVSRDPDG